jgi:RpiR family carbohydrate utilization transcriptional regulator
MTETPDSDSGSGSGSAPAPQSHGEGILTRVRVAIDSLHPAERRVAALVLDEPDRVVNLPIAALARLADVSEGTVIRFCNAVGHRGYQALKLAIARDLATPALMILEDIVAADATDPALVAKKVFASDIVALQDTLKILDPDDISAAVRSIESASELAFFAVGSSLAVASDAALRFARIGLRANVVHDAHSQIVMASLLPPTATAIAISHSGVSREPVECLATAKARGATTIAVTARSPSPLTEHADLVLLTVSSETRYREEAMASRIAQLSLLDSLYVAVAIRHSETSLEALRETSDALAAHRLR